MPVELATDCIELDMALISSSVLSATPHCAQELDMTPLLASNIVSKLDTQSLIAGQPSVVEPSPPKTLYEVALSRPSKK